MIELPTPPADTPYWTCRTQLSGTDFELYYAYNSRAESWTLTISAIGDGAEEPSPVLTGAKLFIGFDLLRRCKHPKRPLGRLYVYSVDQRFEHPKMNELGSRVNLLYVEPGESFSG